MAGKSIIRVELTARLTMPKCYLAMYLHKDKFIGWGDEIIERIRLSFGIQEAIVSAFCRIFNPCLV